MSDIIDFFEERDSPPKEHVAISHYRHPTSYVISALVKLEKYGQEVESFDSLEIDANLVYENELNGVTVYAPEPVGKYWLSDDWMKGAFRVTEPDKIIVERHN